MLDPRFKKLHFSKPTALANAMSTIQDAINEMLRTEDNAAAEQLNQHAVRAAETASDDIWSLHDEAAASQSVHHAEDVAGGFAVELRQYVNRPVLDRNSNPFEAWVTLKTEYPHLYTLSLKYLPTICTSVPAERLFSVAKLIWNDLRSRLTSGHLNMLLFLTSVSESAWDSV